MKGGEAMDIAGLSTMMKTTDIMTQVSVGVLNQNMDNIETMGDSMVKMMEASVSPHLGQNIDFSV